MKNQASIETIIIFSISVVIILVLLNTAINSQSSTSDALRISQARTTVNELITTAEELWSQGPGAKTTIKIVIPDEINESVSGIINSKTVNFRVLTRSGYTDVSDVSSINLTGVLPLHGGQYIVTLTARDNDVLLSTVKELLITTNQDSYCEGDTIYYTVRTTEGGIGYNTNVTIQLLDTNGIIRDEDNVTTINGIANGTLIIPSINDYGWWKVYAFTNETYSFKNVLVSSCGTTTNITITNCYTNNTNLILGEKTNLSCWVGSANPISSVIYTINNVNYSAINSISSWYNYEFNCNINGNYSWTTAWANDSLGYSTQTTSNGLPIIINCSTPECVSGNYSWITNNETSFNEGVYNNTQWNDSWVEVASGSSGSYISKVFDSGTITDWLNMSWVSNYITSNGEIVLLLHLEESSSPFQDSSPYNNDATCNGNRCPSSVNGYSGNALSFDGNNDYITVNDDDSLDVNNMTISLWVKRTSDASWSVLFEKRNQYRVRIDGDNKPIFYVGGFGEAYSNTSLPLNEWALLTCVFINNGGGNNYALIYINNELVGERGPAWGNPSSNNYQLVIGANRHGNNNFPGVIDEFIISNYSSIITGLTANYRVCDDQSCSGEAWSSDYYQPFTINESGRYFQYKFNMITGAKLYNVTVNYRINCLTVHDTSINDTQLCIGDYACINTSVSGSNISDVWVTINGDDYLLSDTGAWCAGLSNDGVYGLLMQFNNTGTYTLESGNANNTLGQSDTESVGIDVGVSYCGNFSECSTNSDCASGYCRQDFVNDSKWYCVADSDDCTEAGINRYNGYIACVDNQTQIICDNGVWVNESSCVSYAGCNTSSIKSDYCGWMQISGSCTAEIGCNNYNNGSCNDCGSFYEDAPFNSCSYSSGINYCDEGCGAECDDSSDYYFNDAGDQCSYDCNNSCEYSQVVTCGDPGDIYGTTCYYGSNGCDNTGCLTSTEECPYYCINDGDGGPCLTTTRTNPSNNDVCYYNRDCDSNNGCTLISNEVLRINYCDYCTDSGVVSGDYSPELSPVCSNNCPNSGVRYWDETISRDDDCTNGVTNINTEQYKKGFIYPDQTSSGYCDNTECYNDCFGSCVNNNCQCAPLINLTVFNEDFNPTPYYNYNWSRLGTDWDSKDNLNCHSYGGCAHADGYCSETTDWIVTNNNLINLSGANNAYLDFWVRSDASFDPGDYLRVWCYDGSNWVVAYEEDCGEWTNTGTYYHRETVIPSQCWISNARFKITIIANSYAEDVFIDDFRIKKEVYNI